MDFVITWGDASPEFCELELTTKGRYAVTAMADIAGQGDVLAVPLSQIAERQGLPLAYLEQIFIGLRRAGLVESARGRSGGYRLGREASNISILAIMEAAEEDTHFTQCVDNGPHCSRDTPCLTHGLWQKLGNVTNAFFSSVSLADVVEKKIPNVRTPSVSLSPNRIYLDYNATAPLRPEAKTAMIAAFDVSGNPSSVHCEGRRARGIVEAARESVARLVGAKPSEVVFTSGATEANAWVMVQPWGTIFASGIEHDSVLAPARANGATVIEIATDRDGRVAVEDFAARILTGAPTGRTLLVLQLANNETGVLQDVTAAAAFAREHGIFVHTDAVQAPGRVPVDFAILNVDTMSLSAHKFGGPKGIGALIIRDHVDLVPFVRGGGQERRRRAGTENLAGIAGFGAAAEAALAQLKSASRIASLRDHLERAVRDAVPATVIIAEGSKRLSNTTSLSLPGKLAETLVIRLDLAGISVSAGSACSSGKVGTSHVLEAMGLQHDVSAGAIRVSLGPETTQNDIAAFVAVWKVITVKTALAA